MDRLVDLDAVAAVLDRRRTTWVARGLEVGALTWRDAAAAWPAPVLTERRSVREPGSLGLSLRGPNGSAALLVLWTGGWADQDLLLGEDVETTCPAFDDVASCVAVVDELVRRLSAT